MFHSVSLLNQAPLARGSCALPSVLLYFFNQVFLKLLLLLFSHKLQIMLVIELLPNGDLRSHLLHIRTNMEGGVTIDDHTLLSYCRQVVSGMGYLSNKGFVHRDLAARNILVSVEGMCKVWIIISSK